MNMKKSIFTFAIALFSICAIAQNNLLTFSVNTIAYSSDGNDVKSGAIFSFNAINPFSSTENIAIDVKCYTSIGSKEKGEDNVWFCTSSKDRIKTKIIFVYMPIQSPKQICYGEILNFLQDYLETIYGQGNVTVVQ